MERNRKSNGYLMRKTIFNIGYKICRAILIFGLCFLIVQPLLNKISLSFMEEQDLYDSTIVNIPRHFTTSSYKLTSQLMKYWKALGTTAYISLLVSALRWQLQRWLVMDLQDISSRLRTSGSLWLYLLSLSRHRQLWLHCTLTLHTLTRLELFHLFPAGLLIF